MCEVMIIRASKIASPIARLILVARPEISLALGCHASDFASPAYITD